MQNGSYNYLPQAHPAVLPTQPSLSPAEIFGEEPISHY